MLNYIRKNIEAAQEQAKQKISLTLNSMGYFLVTDIHNNGSIETRIYQWTNTEKKHCIQLIWDGKEDWFDLGEFHFTDKLNYLSAIRIILVPVKRVKFFNRKDYINRIVDKLIKAINKKIQAE